MPAARTKSKPRGGALGRSRRAGSSRARSRSSRSGTRAGKAARRRAPRPHRLRKAGARVAHHLSPRARDVLGIALIVLAVLSVLGLWLNGGGPFGQVLVVSTRGLFG